MKEQIRRWKTAKTNCLSLDLSMRFAVIIRGERHLRGHNKYLSLRNQMHSDLSFHSVTRFCSLRASNWFLRLFGWPIFTLLGVTRSGAMIDCTSQTQRFDFRRRWKLKCGSLSAFSLLIVRWGPFPLRFLPLIHLNAHEAGKWFRRDSQHIRVICTLYI